MTTTRQLDLIDHKLTTAEELLNSARMATQSDTPDWPDGIDAAIKAVQTAESALRSIVQGARDDGATWEQIGTLAGITRQGAQQRWG